MLVEILRVIAFQRCMACLWTPRNNFIIGKLRCGWLTSLFREGRQSTRCRWQWWRCVVVFRNFFTLKWVRILSRKTQRSAPGNGKYARPNSATFDFPSKMGRLRKTFQTDSTIRIQNTGRIVGPRPEMERGRKNKVRGPWMNTEKSVYSQLFLVIAHYRARYF